MIGRMHANEGMDATSVHEGFACTGSGGEGGWHRHAIEGDMCMALWARGRQTIN